MNGNATAPRQDPLASQPGIFVGRNTIIRYSLYRRQPTSINPRAVNQAVNRPLPVPPMPGQFRPQTLTQPQQREVDIEAFNIMWPMYDGAPPGFVRDKLPLAKGKVMFRNAQNTKIVGYSNPGETPECVVLSSEPVLDNDVVPSHVLTVHQGSNVRYFPVHQIIFAANCATLPDFPYSESCLDNLSDYYTLPVVRLEVPSLRSFHVLHRYLYTKDTNLLRTALTPPHGEVCNATLYHKIEFIRELWMNACALCVVDSALYIVLQDLYVAHQRGISTQPPEFRYWS
ncbi:hypothetical protein BYT27DRAFT_7197352 [Phlegmacium glaucopus]|nr:hypothetical protein BYT27DRAFT_7197352 [Phlegmacium glaucopus]